MPGDVDKSLLERLQALRGSSSGASSQAAPITFSVDVIERSKPATREDTLAARLKSLRAQDGGSTSSPGRKSLETEKTATSVIPPSSSSESRPTKAGNMVLKEKQKPAELEDGDDADFMFSTDDQTLEELLGDVSVDENLVTEPSDEQVRALLEELSLSVPKDNADEGGQEKETAEDSDDSDGEHMQTKANDVIARLKDEIELEATLRNTADDDEAESTDQNQEENQNDDGDTGPAGIDFVIPSLPSNLDNLSASSPGRAGATADMDDIAARMAALRAPTTDDSFSLPSVPSSKPSAGDKPVKRLTSKTDYTDDDIDSWCTVCLNDATLRCLGCDDDPYCTRCWREMHIGPAAAFDDRSHKAVQFTRARKKDQRRVALGA
ncbi:hypothetical protein TGAM01_v202874 [Trichoderma gamsii]|uniref:Abscission/NoCut checkpoint regulator n=1 Tax=Trichoderma gamsii TaxID=398673 RepID=A0A2P4ZVR5_9HYPO|nr:hypothetical protein TGAM01_v202874 [Trichoderma gamsii]PON28381.1 hypothetical protein TGAM01_v202874 [Trichoderma gamsii]